MLAGTDTMVLELPLRVTEVMVGVSVEGNCTCTYASVERAFRVVNVIA
jgi:hypothetical protein